VEIVFSKLIDQLNSSVFILLALIALSGWILYRGGRWTERFASHGEKLDGIAPLTEKVTRLEAKVDLIYQHVNPNRAVQAYSPISLTDVGRDISAKIKAPSILERCYPSLKNHPEIISAKNAYDIQMACMRIARAEFEKCLNEDELVAVKLEAYNRGNLLEDVLAVFGVLLRNRVLEEKGIPVSEVDRHQPAR
jgi:hypothetical protein